MTEIIFYAALLLAGGLPGAEQGGLNRYQASEVHMGASFTIILYGPDEETANRAMKAAFGRIGQLDQILSDYKADSELSRLSRSAPTPEPVKLGEDLWRVLEASQALSKRTDGAFDVTVGPLTKLWRRARAQKKLPSPERLEEALAAVGYQHMQLDPQARTVRLLKPGMRLDLGAIAKGYAADEALEVLAEMGIDRALVNAGGGMAMSEAPPGKPGWTIGVAPLGPEAEPSKFLEVADCGVATSGDAWQFVELEGMRYSHIVNPITGLGLTQHAGVTVIAPDGMAADALATAVSVLGPEKGFELIEQTPGTAAIFVQAGADGQTIVQHSPSFEQVVDRY